MDNAMVKRGIGAVVLAVIAALLLGYLLKDKSRDRQDVVEMKLPGAPEINIPSLSDVGDKVSESAATLVEGTKETVSDASSAVVAAASGTLTTASDAVEAVTDSVSTTVDTATKAVTETVAEATTSTENSSDPGFSFRPATKNEEQQINTSSSTEGDKATETATTTEASSTTVVASAPKAETEKEFKPTIEKETKEEVVKKETKKKEVAKKAEAPKAKPVTASASGKYTIQLLATSSQSRANKLAKTMNSEGYVSFITQTNSNNKILYRVRVGGHKNRNSALKAQQSMKRRYQKNFFVQNSLVVSQ